VSYKHLDVWQSAKDVEQEIRSMVLEEIPKYDMWKEGTELRRASKSVISGIVEATGKRGNKQNFIRCLKSSIDSNADAVGHLRSLFDSGALTDTIFYERLLAKMKIVDEQLHAFIHTVEQEHPKKR
jgi:four helix bundle protein